MEYELVGWPDDAVTLDLDHRAFAYAGKFRMSSTGKAVVRDAGTVVAAVAFGPDRADDATARVRYVTVREDRLGEGIGPRLLAVLVDALHDRGYAVVKIAVNNPYAYEAAYRAGFGDAGEETGLAERVLAHPPPSDREPAAYRAGLAAVADREDRTDAERSFVAAHREAGPPAVVATPGESEWSRDEDPSPRDGGS